jgi:sarcosine oxidase, subunit beta
MVWSRQKCSGAATNSNQDEFSKEDRVNRADVVIVGGGVNGASTAFHLTRAGVKRVIVCEQRHLGAGATGKSGALVRTHYTNEPETRLAFASHAYFANWAEIVGGDCGFRRVGLIVLAPREYLGDLEANVAMHRRVGVDARVITAAEAREIDPSLNVDDVTHVAYEPNSGYADPNATTYSFARAAMDRGAEFRLDTRVLRVLTEGARVTGVETTGGSITAPAVVVCAGGWANHLFRPLGLDFGLVPGLARVTIFRWAFDRSPNHPTYIDHVNHTWARPHDGNCTLIGVESRTAPLPTDPDAYAEAVTQDYVEDCRAALVKRFPAMRHSTVRGNWQGVIMRSPDSAPIIDQVPAHAGLFCMAGDSGTSFKTSPAIGKCLAEWIVDGAPKTVDLRPFRSTRFAEGRPRIDEHNYGTAPATVSR